MRTDLKLAFLLLSITIGCAPTKAPKEETEEIVTAQDSSLIQMLDVQPPTLPGKQESSAVKREIRKDPYYNGHLSTYFDPKLANFSKEYLELREAYVKEHGVEVTREMSGYSYILDSLFSYGDEQKNGVIGANYRRIRVHISTTEKSGDSYFKIAGQTNVDGNVCSFQGTMSIYKIYEFKKNFDFPGQATLFATYRFFEDSSQQHVGVFEGSFECSLFLNHDQKTIRLDESMSVADGYNNRTFVGIWTLYNSPVAKKCIWGDGRLPFTFDFDTGDGEMMVNEKYAKNGWQPWIERTEYEITNGTRRLKDVWWE